MSDSIRLSKLMSERGICSRREADRYIEKGLVAVDGEIVSTLGAKFHNDVDIRLLPKAKTMQAKKVTILLNKPLGYLSVHPEKNYPVAKELLTPKRYYGGSFNEERFISENLDSFGVAGRLDINSKGLLVFSNNGAIIKKIIGPDSEIEKEYIVRVEGGINQGVIRKLRFGLSLDGKRLKIAGIDLLQPQVLRFTLKEGKKRQIRRMCELVGLRVSSLKRVRIGNVNLGDLPVGKWRYLSHHEEF